MKKTAFILLSLLPAAAVQAASLPLDIHTQTHTPGESKSIQIAKTHFLPHWQNNDFNFSEPADCTAYPLTHCKGYKIPAPDSYCPGNSLFFSDCICPDSFTKCELPAFGSGAQCDDKYSVCSEDIPRACKLENPDYTNSCPAGTKPDTSQTCSYDSSYSLCCNTCAAYPESEVKDGYEQTAECTDCDGNTHYQVKPKDCGSGFMTCDNGGAPGAEECKSGEQTLYSSCKPKCGAEYTLTTCPTHVICEECDGKYKAIGCTAGYVDEEKYWNGE